MTQCHHVQPNPRYRSRISSIRSGEFLRRFSSFSFFAGRFDMFRMNSFERTESLSSNIECKRAKKKKKLKKSKSGCSRYCFLLKCFEFMGNPSTSQLSLGESFFPFLQNFINIG